jgi:hypothetical protein
MNFFGAHLRIGELLIDAKIVSKDQIAHAVSVAERRELPVGRSLVMLGFISASLLQDAIDAQALFRDGLISQEESIVAMKIAAAEDISLTQALKDLRLKVNTNVATSRLGELLVDAKIVSLEDMQGLLLRSAESGLPLGRFLSSIGAVPESLIMITLNLQFLIREGRINRDDAITNLSEAKLKNFSPRRSGRMTKLNILASSTNIFLGELFVKAGLVDQSTLMSLAELALLKNQQLGHVLIQNELISPAELQTALLLKGMVAGGLVKPRRATQAMSLVRMKKLSLSAALHQANTSEIAYGDAINLETFLGLAGVINPQDLKELSGQDSTVMFRRMVDNGKASEAFLRDCKQIHTLVVEGLITLDRAIIVLRHCKNTGKSARVNLLELGWQLAV